MNQQQMDTIQACSDGALSGALSFPEIVQRMELAGVERYHADYCRHEATYYLPSGESHVVPLDHAAESIGDRFDKDQIVLAIRQSQANEHTYRDFVRKTMAAGCVGYFVHITGQSVIYFGRRGETHVEKFPGAVN